jgi:hypothetical protein
MEKRNILIALFAACVSLVFAEQSPDQIAQSASFFSTRQSQKISATLEVQLGKERKERELELCFQASDAAKKLLARVTAPAFLREMKVLQISAADASDTWVKTSQGLKRLSTGSRGEALFQSDFLTTDFSVPTSGWRFSPRDGENGSRVLERDGSAAEGFTTQRLFLKPGSSVVEKREFLDASGVAQRVYRVTEWRGSGETAIPVRIELEKVGGKGLSSLTIKELQESPVFPAGLFAPGGL